MTFEQVLWLFSDGVLIAVLGLAIARRAWRFLPWFVIYLTLVVVVDLARWIVFVRSGYASRTYSLVYWLTQPVLVAARAAVLADVCRAALSYYRGVWQLTRYLLGAQPRFFWLWHSPAPWKSQDLFPISFLLSGSWNSRS